VPDGGDIKDKEREVRAGRSQGSKPRVGILIVVYLICMSRIWHMALKHYLGTPRVPSDRGLYLGAFYVVPEDTCAHCVEINTIHSVLSATHVYFHRCNQIQTPCCSCELRPLFKLPVRYLSNRATPGSMAGYEPATSYLMPKLVVFVGSLLGFFLVEALTRLVVVKRLGIPAPADVLATVVSTLHAVVVFSTAAYTFMHGDGVNGAGAEEEPLVGSCGLVISAAYFIWDVRNMVRTDYHPFVPLLLHHLSSGISMAFVAARVPRAVWYTCILQMTEGTVPINNLVYTLEWRQRQGSATYTLCRWGFLLFWLVFRIGFPLYFFHPIWRDWDQLSSVVRLLAANGPALLLFNTVALFWTVLQGFPWRTASKDKRS